MRWKLLRVHLEFYSLISRKRDLSLGSGISLSNYFSFRFGSSSVILISFLALSLQYHHQRRYTPFKSLPNGSAEATVVSRHYSRRNQLWQFVRFNSRVYNRGGLLLPSACDKLILTIHRKDWQILRGHHYGLFLAHSIVVNATIDLQVNDHSPIIQVSGG